MLQKERFNRIKVRMPICVEGAVVPSPLCLLKLQSRSSWALTGDPSLWLGERGHFELHHAGCLLPRHSCPPQEFVAWAGDLKKNLTWSSLVVIHTEVSHPLNPLCFHIVCWIMKQMVYRLGLHAFTRLHYTIACEVNRSCRLELYVSTGSSQLSWQPIGAI